MAMFRRLFILLPIFLSSCIGQSTSTQMLTPTLLPPAVIPSLSPTSSQENTPFAIDAPEIYPSSTAPPWKHVTVLPNLPNSRLFYETATRIYAIDIDCKEYQVDCLSDPYSISPNNGDRGGMNVSPNGQFVAIELVEPYGSLGLQASVRLISVAKRQIWSVGLIGTRSPVWSPDSDRIAYIDYLVSGGEFSRVCISTTTDPLRCFPHSSRFSSLTDLAWSPNGQFISYIENPDMFYPGELYVIDLDSSQVHHIADDVSKPIWSPDGKVLFYSRYQEVGSDILIGANIEQCIDQIASCSKEYELQFPYETFTFSPGGNYALIYGENGYGITSSSCILNREQCADQVKALQLPSRNKVATSWAPDNRHIAFAYLSELSGGIYVFDIERGETMAIDQLEPTYYQNIAWRNQ